ncbi:hypothetical protein FEE96_03505 [Parasedimentitalea maritima]|uniref:Sulfotransferase domain-containing protein n=1 Tax=Parasedimentitalea maritima TaxID=2578117 RepID=A0ABY2V0Y6_9RHOB|nr:hypothetical protein [Zongyanglinia marina]TLP69361.1 hypothetical protein FEE96_03505 [Zongyanglinia marina]
MKNVIVHLGPHKTGSTSIQKCLTESSTDLVSGGISFLHDSETLEAATLLSRELFDEAEEKMSKLSIAISNLKVDTVILSQEDFSGNLIGRTNKRRIYPKLTKNMRIISRSLRPHNVRFVFFEREESEWMRSCYHQHLKYRTKFSSLPEFKEHFESPWNWTQKLERAHHVFGEKLIVFPYSATPKDGVNALLSLATTSTSGKLEHLFSFQENISPKRDVIEKLERVNRLTEFPATAWLAKKMLLDEWAPKRVPDSEICYSIWPPEVEQKQSVALPNLMERTRHRVPTHQVSDLLPELDVDLLPMLTTILPNDEFLTDASRQQMENQSKILRYHLRGKSELSYLNGLTISYLRRDTKYTDKARHLFHRIWDEHGLSMINELSTRWLISSLQTFFDHGKSESQRLIGSAAYFYANMIKIYESERSIEGSQPDAVYESETPQTSNMFRGLDRFSVGGSDLMLNTNALALEIAAKDDVAGLVFQEFMLRVKSSKNVFSRQDTTRLELGVAKEGFIDTWSFFEEPEK